MGRAIINNQIVKKQSDKIRRKTLRDARYKVRRGHLFDSHTFGAYLYSIDERFAHLRAVIESTTSLIDYARIRRERVAETRQLLDFFEQDYQELSQLSTIVATKAKEANRVEELRQEKRTSIDLTRVRNEFAKLVEGDR